MKAHKSWKGRLAQLVGAAAFVSITAAVGTVSQAQVNIYSTNFDSFTTETLSGQPVGVSPNWDTNDADNGVLTATNKSIGQSDYVGTLTNYSNPAATDKFGALGGLQHNSPSSGPPATTGVVPGASTVYLFRNFTLPSTNMIAFNVDFAIPESSGTVANPGVNDRFAWTFQNAGGTNLFSVDFVPETTAATTTGSKIPFDLMTTVGGIQTPSGKAMDSSSLYHLAININVPNKTFTFTLTPTDGTTPYTSNTISLGTIDPTTVTDIAATWNLNDTSNVSNGGYQNAGTNALIFNNYAVTVPEPSTWATISVAAAGLVAFAWRRRLAA